MVIRNGVVPSVKCKEKEKCLAYTDNTNEIGNMSSKRLSYRKVPK